MKIIISGGASGLGLAVTEKLAESGHDILVTYCNSERQAQELEQRLKLEIAQVDFRDKASIDELCLSIGEFQPDVLINNAITGLDKKHFHKTDTESFSKSFAENVYPILRMTQAAIEVFRKKKFGKIVTILSAALVDRPPIGWSSYVANKSYLQSMCKSWAVENARFNITSNCISPAYMQTPLNQDTDERLVQNMVQAHPLKQLLTVEEVASVVEFFVDATQQINGTNMLINSAEHVI